ncbi:MAG: sugar ABC transporter permease [Clostridiales bacterium]|jgi:multiple sugar transport system permease protein|nr:sugar ABC transporter permease [Clostridiales bacterium]
MNTSSATIAQDNSTPFEAQGMWLLRITGVLCAVLGVLELAAAAASLGLFGEEFVPPLAEAMLSAGFVGIAFGALYIAMGIFGVICSKAQNMAKIQAAMCILALIFHVALLIFSFFGDGFSYISILLLAIPIMYLLGAAQNIASRSIRNTAVAYSFIAPNLIGFSIFTLIPMGFALALGFMQWDLADNSFIFVGLDNFMRMRTDHLFWPSLRNTIHFTAITVPLTMVFALSLALLLNNQIKGRAIFRSVMFFPHVASLIAMAAVWNLIFHPSWGPVNQFLVSLGMEEGPRWTITPWIIPNLAFFTAWRNMGYFMIIYLAGLQGIPKELYEAASIDGAGAWKRFIYITLPQLRFVTFFVTVMITIMSFRVFEQVIMITNTDTPGSGATMMVVHIFRLAFINWDFGYASAVALVLLALVMSITIIQFLIQKRHERDY